MDIRLVQLSDYGFHDYPIEGKEFVIGREPSCHLRMDHGQISHRHCRLFWRAGQWLIEDLNSASGTFVNQDRVLDPVELRDGDDIHIGPVPFLIHVATDAEASTERLEDWVRTTLQSKRQVVVGTSPSDSNIVSPVAQTARRILDRITTHTEGAIDFGASAPPGELSKAKRKGLVISESSGIALVKILNRSLVDDAEIGRIARDLQALIESGRNRIALNFGNVEHLSSQALGTLLKAHRQCKDEGGTLKICTLQPAVAELFAMTNLHNRIEIFPDELPALESLWPHKTDASEEDDEDSARPPSRARPPASAPTGSRGPDPAAAASASMPHVRLIVEVGRAKGRSIEIRGPRFVIGRDHRCQLRPNSDTISRVHALIEMRDGRVFVRDYGTKNGTILNERTLRGEEAEVSDGDALQVGILKFRFQIEPGTGKAPAAVEDELAAWLLGQDATDADASTALLIPTMPQPPAEPESATSGPGPELTEAPTAPVPSMAESIPANQLGYQIVNGVLVVTIPQGELDDESTVGPFRHNLNTLLDHPLPRRVVLDLENLHYLSSRAVGVILAYFQRLDRVGGALRVCCVSPKILPVLDQMRLPRMIDMYASVDEAVSDPWI